MENEKPIQAPPVEAPAEQSPTAETPTKAPAEPTQDAQEPDMDLDALIEEAERRGYLRGRNEAIGQVKRRLAQWEVPRVAEPQPTDSTPTILANLPKSIWDR